MAYTQRRSRIRAGFTLIEIGIVIGVIGLLVAILIRPVTNTLNRARIQNTEVVLKRVQSALDTYKLDTKSYPEDLDALINQPEGVKRWRGPYLEKASDLQDAWGNDLQYELTPNEEHPYELYSWGPNGPGSPENQHISVWQEE